jgi:hopanoid biosynthesis associated protein HpnK
VKKIIITADDFGLSGGVNEAILEAHRSGVLTTASLMVGGRAAKDAIVHAQQVPSLRVGLHLVLVDGSPLLPPRAVPDLVDSRGEFSSHLFRAGVNFFFRPKVRQQLEREIRVQFEAFLKNGLPLDHVNCHHHIHLHPTVGALILKVGREFGLRAMRYPYEPVFPSFLASRKALAGKLLSRLFLLPWLALLRNQMRQAGVHSNHFLFGMNDSGNMNLNLVLRFLRYLPQGISEIYFHPASRRSPELERTMASYHFQEEFAALTSPVLRQTLRASGIQCIGFSDL